MGERGELGYTELFIHSVQAHHNLGEIDSQTYRFDWLLTRRLLYPISWPPGIVTQPTASHAVHRGGECVLCTAVHTVEARVTTTWGEIGSGSWESTYVTYHNKTAMSSSNYPVYDCATRVDLGWWLCFSATFWAVCGFKARSKASLTCDR